MLCNQTAAVTLSARGKPGRKSSSSGLMSVITKRYGESAELPWFYWDFLLAGDGCDLAYIAVRTLVLPTRSSSFRTLHRNATR